VGEQTLKDLIVELGTTERWSQKPSNKIRRSYGITIADGAPDPAVLHSIDNSIHRP